MENIFKGTGPAVITPFKSSDFAIDFDALDRVLEYQLAGGVDFLVALGTTAESVTMSHEERHQVYQFIKAKNNKRVPLMVGFGGNNTAEVIRHIEAADFNGIDGILSVVPYYSKPSQEGIFQHFMAIAKASPVPVILYNVPSRCGVNMTAETTVRLAKASSKFMGIKEASGNLEQIKTIIAEAPTGFGIISGDDSLIYDVNTNGGQGVISVLANAFPKLTVNLCNRSLQGDPEAQKIQQSLRELIHLLFVEGNPAGVKAMLHQMGIIDNALRLPLCPVSESVYSQISKTIEAFK